MSLIKRNSLLGLIQKSFEKCCMSWRRHGQGMPKKGKEGRKESLLRKEESFETALRAEVHPWPPRCYGQRLFLPSILLATPASTLRGSNSSVRRQQVMETSPGREKPLWPRTGQRCRAGESKQQWGALSSRGLLFPVPTGPVEMQIVALPSLALQKGAALFALPLGSTLCSDRLCHG